MSGFSQITFPILVFVFWINAEVLWTDKIQENATNWGFSGLGVEYPIGTTVTPGDQNMVNISRVTDPIGGSGFAVRHFATFDEGGARSQAGIYGDVNTIFGNQAKRPEGVWVAQEWFFPETINAGGDPYCWINLWDWHCVDTNRGNRWHTSPGLMLSRDGSMKVGFEWGGPAYSINKNSALSSIAMPVGRWFDIEMHYVWSETPDAILTLWIDGQLALEQRGVQTKAANHQIIETYMKFYGSSQGRGPWKPTPSIKYTRNVRIANSRIWKSTAIAFDNNKITQSERPIRLINSGTSIYLTLDRQRIETIQVFAPDGRKIGQRSGSETGSQMGSDFSICNQKSASGIKLFWMKGSGAGSFRDVDIVR